MKKICLAIPFFFFFVFASLTLSAQTPESPKRDTVHVADGVTAIAVSDLPEAVTKALKGEDYTGWTIDKAEKIKKGSAVVYQVELINGDMRKSVSFDADGNPLD